MLSYLLFTIGLVVLVIGGNSLVKGAVGLAEKLGISPLIIGLTIVAFGTSAPELVISLKAALSGSGELAVGNVVGSNIANVLLVLGVPAILTATACQEDDMKVTLFFLVGLTLVFMLQMAFGPINRLDGLLLLVCLAVFLMLQYRNAQRQTSEKAALLAADDYHDEVGVVPAKPAVIAGLLITGLVFLPLGASLTVDSAVDIAERWHVPQDVIGLTIVAIGTSLPELATGIMAARQGNTSVAVGNVVGSNLFNIAAIMGVTATVVAVPVSQHIVMFDMWIMLAATLFLIAMPFLHLTITRTLGFTLTGAYALYLIFTVVL